MAYMVEIVWNNQGKILTETVLKIDVNDKPHAMGQELGISMFDLLQPGTTMYEDDMGLFCVPNEDLISERKIDNGPVT